MSRTETVFSPGDLIEVREAHPAALRGLQGAKARVRAILPSPKPRGYEAFLLMRLNIKSTRHAGMELTAWVLPHLLARFSEVCQCSAYPFPHKVGSGQCYTTEP